MTIETYQCPQCSAPLIWKNGELVCESCGASYKEEDMRALSEAMQENAGQSSLDWNKCRNAQTFTAQEESALQEYNCPACGAVLVTSAATAATKCAYCGNNALIPKQFSGELRPDAILPFTVSREDAEKKLREHFHGKKLLPDDFVRACRVEDVEGLYVPYFLFNCQADARCTYRAERVNTYRRGDWQITDTLHFYVERCGRVSFDRVPVDACKRVDDTLTEALEPFDYAACKPFDPGYLAGYQADCRDQEMDECVPRANERVTNAATDALLFTQTFTNLAEEAGLGTCFLGTTVYMPKMIIDTLKLPKLVMPVATLTIGWPDEQPAQSDRLPLRSIIHNEHFEDYTPEKIDDFYAEKESLEENQEFVRINNVETLAQVFTDIRYTKKDCEAMSIGFLDALKQQGFLK